jgi:hypothetical protein
MEKWEIRQGVGPFSDRENDYQPYDIVTVNFNEFDGVGERICTLADGWGKKDKDRAHLIAAAPALYDALEECVIAIDWIKSPDASLTDKGASRLLAKARAALKLARGEK